MKRKKKKMKKVFLELISGCERKLLLTLVHSCMRTTIRSSDSSFSGTDSISLRSSSCGWMKIRLDSKNEKTKFCGEKKENLLISATFFASQNWWWKVFMTLLQREMTLTFAKLRKVWTFLTWSISAALWGISRLVSASSGPFNCGVKFYNFESLANIKTLTIMPFASVTIPSWRITIVESSNGAEQLLFA